MPHDRVRLFAVLATIALLVILAPLPGASAGPDPADSTIRLRMANGAGTFTYQDADPNTFNLIQSFTTTKQCGAQGPQNLVSLDAVSGNVGFATHSLGVRGPGEGASGKCEQVNIPSQVLKLRLGSDAALAGKVFDFAELDIEAKFNAAINIAIFHGVPSVDTQVDADPADVGDAGDDDPVTLNIDESKLLVITCTSSGSDCGPDDSARDNFRERVPSANGAPFTELWLWATGSDVSGAVGLEGGADGTAPLPGGLGAAIGTSDTIFHLQGMIDCEDDPATTNIIENQATATDPQLADITVTRFSNVDQAECSPKAYLIRTAVETIPGEGDVNVVTFLENDDSGQQAHYQMRVSWTYPRRDPVDDPANPATVGGRTFYIDYDGSGTFVEAELCPVVAYDTQGDPVPAMHPAGLPWCITAQEYSIGSDGMVHLVQDWDGFGDPRSY